MRSLEITLLASIGLVKSKSEQLMKYIGQVIWSNVTRDIPSAEDRVIAVKSMQKGIKAGLYHCKKLPDKERLSCKLLVKIYEVCWQDISPWSCTSKASGAYIFMGSVTLPIWADVSLDSHKMRMSQLMSILGTFALNINSIARNEDRRIRLTCLHPRCHPIQITW